MYVRMRDKLVDVSSLRPKFQVISRGSWTPHLARYLTDDTDDRCYLYLFRFTRSTRKKRFDLSIRLLLFVG